MTSRKPEAETQEEEREHAELAPEDPHTKREELELDLMDEDESELGEQLG